LVFCFIRVIIKIVKKYKKLKRKGEIKMKNFKLELYKENGLDSIVFISANGKEEAIEKHMNKLFLRHFYIYMNIVKVEAIEMN
jgi:hypothetical protein